MHQGRGKARCFLLSFGIKKIAHPFCTTGKAFFGSVKEVYETEVLEHCSQLINNGSKVVMIFPSICNVLEIRNEK